MHPHFIIGGEEFPLLTRTVSIGGTDVPLSLVPYDPAQLDRIVAIRGLGEKAWPYWLEEWPATYALAEILDGEDASEWNGPILDLGCGSGFLAAYLRLRFGLKPFSCDFNADACRLAAHNAGPRRRVFCADFSAFPSRAAFGVVFAGEMLYAKANHRPILDFLARHLAPQGKAFLADPGRSAASGFPEAAALAGFQVEIRETKMRDDKRIVHVYKLSRGPGG
jgi:SAM-dependent methyltransferase